MVLRSAKSREGPPAMLRPGMGARELAYSDELKPLNPGSLVE
jgi:hypothetical protein